MIAKMDMRVRKGKSGQRILIGGNDSKMLPVL